jgi:hypothetical protein
MVRICQPGWLIQSYYRLGDRSSAPGGWKGFSSTLCVHTGSEAHLASRAMETGGGGVWGLSLEVKRSRDVKLTAHAYLLPRSRTNRSFTLSPLKRPQGV